MGIIQMIMGGGAGGIDPREHFDVKLYTGNGNSSNAQTGLNFSPDFAWLKPRSAAYSHNLYDTIRGDNKRLVSNADSAEQTVGFEFQSNGFDPTGSNDNGTTYVTWAWNAGGSTVSNTDGSITSSVRANTDAGFSIVTYTGVNNATPTSFGHGLNSEPKFVIIKNRTDGEDWAVYHASVGNTKYLQLNENTAATDDSGYWNDTSPTTTVVTLNNSNDVQRINRNYLALCWSEVAGFSKFGTYSGGTNPKVITCGFEPTFVIIKRTDTAGHWHLIDSERGGTKKLGADVAAAENDASTVGGDTHNTVVFESNGFKLTDTRGGTNISGGTYVYASWA